MVITTSVANNSINTRNGNIYLTADNGDQYTVSVTQNASSPSSNVNPKYWEVGYGGDTVTAALTANWGASWSTADVPNWITPAISNNYSNNATLSLKVAANSQATGRIATFTVKNDNHSYSVSVNQAGAGYSYTVDPTSLSFGYSGETKTSTITTNGNGSFAVKSKPDWCTVTFTNNNSSNTTVNVKAAANTVTDSRTGTIKLSTNDIQELNISVSQTGIPKTTSIEKTSVTLGTAVSSKTTVTLSGNYDAVWSAFEEIEWCSVLIKNNQSSSATLEITATVANETINTRSGNIIVTADNGDSYSINVTQSASSPSSSVIPQYFNVGYGATSESASLNANWGASWNTSGVPSWITATIGKNYTNNATLNLSILENTQATSRVGTFTLNNEYQSFDIGVTQDGAGYKFDISPISLSFSSNGETKTSTITVNGIGTYTVKSKPDWCTVTFSNNSSSSTTVNVKASATNTTDTRSGTVKITTNDGQELNISVSQAGIPKETSVTTESITVGKAIGATGTATLSANYNAEWRVSEEIE